MNANGQDIQNSADEARIDAAAILNRLSEARKLTTGWGQDAALGRAFGISSKRISGWRDRNTLDHLVVILKCKEWGLSINWVYFGDGVPDATPTPPRLDTAAEIREISEHLNAVVRRFEAERLAQNQTGDVAAADSIG